jgi:hypothetical protein
MQIRGRSSRFASVGAPVALVVLIAALFTASPVAAAYPASAVLRTGLPNRTLTPGATNPAVTQATIHKTICVSGWTATVRPPSSYTTALKFRQLVAYGFGDRRLGDYEEDHLISLELGGSPRSAMNLWPEPHHIVVGGVDLGSLTKDVLENALKREVCAGTISLATAQHEIAGNWVKYWKLSKTGSATAPVPTPGPTPEPPPTSGGSAAVKITSLTSPVSGGATATATAHTAAGAACSISVEYKSGPSSAAGLGSKAADGSGVVSWSWTVGTRTTAGSWPVTVTCTAAGATSSATAYLVVT